MCVLTDGSRLLRASPADVRMIVEALEAKINEMDQATHASVAKWHAALAAVRAVASKLTKLG